METEQPMSRLLRRLGAATTLSDDDHALIHRLPCVVRTFESQSDIVHEGDRPSHCCLVLQGQLVRSRISSESKRQITSFHVPGDIPDLHNLYLKGADHNITALGRSVVCFIAHDVLHVAISQSLAITQALWRETLIESSICREWERSLGGRDGAARVAHLLCEIIMRLQVANLSANLTFALPWTQHDIGDACGLSNVHVNRVIQTLRSKGVIDWRSKVMKIARWEELVRIARFSPDYLHLPENERFNAGRPKGNIARLGV